MTLPSPLRILLPLVTTGFLLIVADKCEAQAAAAQNPPTIRATTRLVEIHVVVHDKQGSPVAGLTQDDFTILDGGKDEPISVFSVESSRTPKGPFQPLPPNVFSNRVARQGGIPTSASVLLLDGIDSTFWDLAYARRQLIGFLSQLEPQDRVALYFLGRRLTLVQDFTSDPSPLLEALRGFQGQPTSPPTSNREGPATQARFEGLSGPAAVAARKLDAGMTVLMDEVVRSYWGERTLDSLLAIAEHLAGVPGRKTLVWVTGGIPFGLHDDPRESSKFRRLMLELNHADVAVYPVDARGLYTDPTFNAEGEHAHDGLPPTFERYDRGQYGTGLAEMNAMLLAMIRTAHETGGRAFYNTNDLKTALRKALDDSEITYTLGYYPSHGKWDGSFRPLKVLVNRRELEVRHRLGYYSRTDLPVDSEDPVALLREAAERPLDATGIGLTVRTTPLDTIGNQVEVAVNVDAKDLTFEPAQDVWTVRFDTWLGQYDIKGGSLTGTTKTTAADLKESSFKKIMNEGGVRLTFLERIQPGAQEFRLVVRDVPSGSIGSVRIPLEKLLTESAHQATTRDDVPR